MAELPIAPHADDDNMISRRFGREVANYFSGSPLNRLSFLRDDRSFLAAAFSHPSSRFLLLNSLAPLSSSPSSIALVSNADVTPATGENPYASSEASLLENFDSRQPFPPHLLFLGIDESSPSDADPFKWDAYTGAPHFALDVTPRPIYHTLAPATTTALEALIAAREGHGESFLQGRAHMSFAARDAALYAEARSALDWNARNPFCAGCGQRTVSVSAGFKRGCPVADAALPPLAPGSAGAKESDGTPLKGNRPPCPTHLAAVSNLSFPRTDPTIIVACLSHDGRRVLLGRQARWPARWYSALAGFVESGEAVEEAVRREVWEEAGVEVGRVAMHSSQPWPYPASLMLGCVAVAAARRTRAAKGGEAGDDGEKVMLKDKELEDARWFSLEEVREALVERTMNLNDADKEMKEQEAQTRDGEKKGEQPWGGNGKLRLPPKQAIAHQLLNAVANGWAGIGGEKL